MGSIPSDDLSLFSETSEKGLYPTQWCKNNAGTRYKGFHNPSLDRLRAL